MTQSAASPERVSFALGFGVQIVRITQNLPHTIDQLFACAGHRKHAALIAFEQADSQTCLPVAGSDR